MRVIERAPWKDPADPMEGLIVHDAGLATSARPWAREHRSKGASALTRTGLLGRSLRVGDAMNARPPGDLPRLRMLRSASSRSRPTCSRPTAPRGASPDPARSGRAHRPAKLQPELRRMSPIRGPGCREPSPCEGPASVSVWQTHPVQFQGFTPVPQKVRRKSQPSRGLTLEECPLRIDSRSTLPFRSGMPAARTFISPAPPRFLDSLHRPMELVCEHRIPLPARLRDLRDQQQRVVPATLCRSNSEPQISSMCPCCRMALDDHDTRRNSGLRRGR
jgi:hypothetical protein